MTRRLAVTGLALLVACASLPDAGNGAVALEVQTPAATSLAIGSTLALHARALNLQGDSVADAVIVWHTPDTALVRLDTALGLVFGRATSGVARIQAQTGTLLSNVINLTLRDSTTASSPHRP